MISASSICLLESENMSSTENSGGGITATVIEDNTPNNVFPKITSAMLLNGATNLNKVYVSVRTSGNEQLSGVRAALISPPEDPTTEVACFLTNSWTDRKKDMVGASATDEETSPEEHPAISDDNNILFRSFFTKNGNRIYL